MTSTGDAVAAVRGALCGVAQVARHKAANARDEEARILKTVTH